MRPKGVILIVRYIAKAMAAFLPEDTGQDLVEYALLLAFVALVGAAAYLGMSRSSNILWTAANSQLAAANASGS